MSEKTIAAGGQPAAGGQDAGQASSSGAHYTMPLTRLDTRRLLERVQLEDLVGKAGGKLHRSGHELRGACPLHGGDNRTAFAVYEGDDGLHHWRCYSNCNAGGNALDFVIRWKGMDFLEAVKFLAEFTGVDLHDIGFTPEAAQREVERRKRSDVMDEATRYFSACLAEHEGAQAYLRGRGLTPEIILKAGWGFSDSGPGLLRHLHQRNFDLALAYELGVLRRDGQDFTANSEGKQASPDGYIVIPHQVGGHAVYFSARAITLPEQMPDRNDKSRNLPGDRQLYWALVPGDNELVIVEGQMDAETLRQWGRSAVALCGLGKLPDSDLPRLQAKRRVYLALDRDDLKPGATRLDKEKAQAKWQIAAERLCGQVGPLTLVVASLPAKDFNELLQLDNFGPEQLAEVLKKAIPWIEMQIDRLKQADPIDLDSQLRHVAAMLPGLPDTLRNRYLRQVEKAANLSRREILALVNNPGAAPAEPVDSVFADVRDGQLCFMGEPLGNFHAHITHEQAVDDGLHAPCVRYTISGKLANNLPLPTVQVDARDFARLDWIPGHWGMRPIINLPPGKQHLLARAIQEVSLASVIQERVYTYTGWTEMNGKRGFLTASGLLTADGMDASVRVDLGENNFSLYTLPKPPTEREAMLQAVRASIEVLHIGPRHVTAPVWAAMFAAPLTSLRSLNSVMSVYGSTQSGKSTLAHLALAHFGGGFIQGRDYRAPIDWISTPTALEGAMFTTKDAPLVIDDFAPQFTSAPEARSMHRKAHYVVRSVGNRSSRGRAMADLSQQTTRIPRGLVLMTAENPLFGQSIVGRMLYIEVRPGDVLPDAQRGDPPNERLNALQPLAQQGLLAQAMALYVQYLARNWERVAASFPEMVDAASDSARKEGKLQNRLPDAFGVLNAAQLVALRCFQDLGLLDGAEAGRLAEENREALLGMISSQAERVADESPVRKFFVALASLLERRKVYLAPRTQKVEYIPPAGADQIGYFDASDPTLVYLRSETCLAAAKRFWRDLDENLDVMPDALRRQLSQVAGLLPQTDKRQVEPLVYCGGVNQRVLVVNAQQVESIYSAALVNPPSNPKPNLQADSPEE